MNHWEYQFIVCSGQGDRRLHPGQNWLTMKGDPLCTFSPLLISTYSFFLCCTPLCLDMSGNDEYTLLSQSSKERAQKREGRAEENREWTALSLLAKVVCEFFQFLQVIWIHCCFLCAQGHQQITLRREREKKKSWMRERYLARCWTMTSTYSLFKSHRARIPYFKKYCCSSNGGFTFLCRPQRSFQGHDTVEKHCATFAPKGTQTSI